MKTGLLNSKLIGKYAYTPIVEAIGIILGRADYGVGGYTPMRYRIFQTYDEARNFADEVNESEGLTKKDAFEIVSNTMR